MALELAWAHLVAMRVDRIVSRATSSATVPSPTGLSLPQRAPDTLRSRGNHDRWAWTADREPGRFGGGTPSHETLEYLANLPPNLVIEAGTRIGVVVHGSPSSDMEFVSRRSHPPAVLRRYLRTLGCDLLVVGHTHLPMWYRSPEGGLVINPGSVVSMPVVDSSRTFAVADLPQWRSTFYAGREPASRLSLDPWE